MASEKVTRTKTWYCTFEYTHKLDGADTWLGHECHVRIHDPEDSFGGQAEKMTWREIPCLSTRLRLRVRHSLDIEPTPGVFYTRELHVSRNHNPEGNKPSGWFAIREGTRYFRPDFSSQGSITRNAVAFYLWETGERELAMQAAETASKEAMTAER